MEMVYLIRVPKTGSQAMRTFIKKILSKQNNYKTYTVPAKISQLPMLNIYEQEKNILELDQFEKSSMFLGNHENYLEFSMFGFRRPTYISLIRDPVEKVISWFYYIRSDLFDLETHYTKMTKEEKDIWLRKTYEDCVLSGDRECTYQPLALPSWSDYRRQSLQFCGNHPNCLIFGSPAGIQMAKANIERDFAVVGSWEDTNITLTVLEHYLPRYFKGALDLFYANHDLLGEKNKNTQKPAISDEVKELVRKNFTGELEFYNFCKQRLYKQYLAVRDKITDDYLDD